MPFTTVPILRPRDCVMAKVSWRRLDPAPFGRPGEAARSSAVVAGLRDVVCAPTLEVFQTDPTVDTRKAVALMNARSTSGVSQRLFDRLVLVSGRIGSRLEARSPLVGLSLWGSSSWWVFRQPSRRCDSGWFSWERTCCPQLGWAWNLHRCFSLGLMKGWILSGLYQQTLHWAP
jgi:hypothetical protein